MKRRYVVLAGAVAVIAEVALIHGPLGVGEGLATRIERYARAELNRQEMTQVQARVERGPIRRTVILSGPADDFQQGELVRIIGSLPGVSRVRWATPPATSVEVR